MDQVSKWQQKRLKAREAFDKSEIRRNARLTRRLRRKTLSCLKRGGSSFRFNRPFANCYPLPHQVIADCQASLPEGVTLSQKFYPGTYEDDLYISISITPPNTSALNS